VEGATIEVAPLWILFEAKRPGTYRLLCGSAGSVTAPGRLRDTAVPGPLTDVPLGDETALPLPAIPERWAEPVLSSMTSDPELTWRIDFDDAGPGDVVSLPVPGKVLEAIGCNPHRLRVLAGDAELPFVIRIPDEPEPVLVLRDLPARRKPLGRSETLRIENPALSACLSQLELFTRAEPAPASVRFRFLEQTRPGLEERAVELHASWRCGDTESVACRAEASAPTAGSTETLEVRVEAPRRSDDSRYDLVAWGPRYELVFVRPRAESLVLAYAGEAARWEPYPLEKGSNLLLSLPWKSASVDPGPSGPPGKGRNVASRIALIAALIATAAALLWILARNLKRP
jgi:hypothetical protein